MTYPVNSQGGDDRLASPFNGGGWDTQHMAAVVVFSAMFFLWAVRRGFRGLNVGGFSVNVK
jgi:hypothetical protein